jgi:hypothetical protein
VGLASCGTAVVSAVRVDGMDADMGPVKGALNPACKRKGFLESLNFANFAGFSSFFNRLLHAP